jgi:hypothetical protein
MKVEFQYTLDDVLEVTRMQRGLWFKKEGAKFIVALIGLAVGIPAVMTLVFNFSMQAGILNAGTAIACMVAILFQSQVLQARRMWESAAWLRDPYTAELTPSGLQMSSSKIQTHRSWDVFVFFVETQNLFVLNQGGQLYAWLPKRAFTAAQLQELRAQLGSNIKTPPQAPGKA